MTDPTEFKLPTLAAAQVRVEHDAEGVLVLSHPAPLAPCLGQLGDYLTLHATNAPDRVFLGARRTDGALDTVTYGEAKRRVDALSQALLDRGLSAERPLAVIAENGIGFGLLKLAAMQVGIPVAPISAAYAKHGGGQDKLRYIIELLRPALIVHDDTVQPALLEGPIAHVDEIERWAQTPVGPAAAEAYARVGPDTLAKILFTSGSTGMPKGVMTTHRMMIANIVAMRQVCPFLAEHPPIIVDWLPWNHCFGGNYHFNMTLVCGGSLYLDTARPVEGVFDATLLTRIPPTFYSNVPVGYERLCAQLEADDAFAARFFSRLDILFYAGSSMPQPLWDRLVAVSRRVVGRPLMIFTSYGSTESTPAHTMAHWPTDGPSHIGVPLPGSRVKLIAAAGQYEIRSKGPNITPGYFRDEARTRALFDDDGWMITDDAVSFVDPSKPSAGLRFHGRIAGNFKLLTGTWVPADEIRIAAIANGAGLVRDAIVTGHDRAEIGLLLFIDPVAAGDRFDAIVRSPDTRARIAAALEAYNAAHPSSSRRIGRFLILEEPPERYAAELTDKGYLNQTLARTSRAALVEALYADPVSAVVVRLK